MPSSVAEVDAHILSWAKEVEPLFGSVLDASRRGENMMALQQYDMMMALPEVENLVQEILQRKEDLELAKQKELQENVLDPHYLERREEDFSVQVDPTATFLAKWEQDFEEVCGAALLAAIHQRPQDEEHHEELVEEFEQLTKRSSDYLRALRFSSSSAMETLSCFRANEGCVSPSVVAASLAKHPPSFTNDLAQIIDLVKQDACPIPLSLARLLEKSYVRCMKSEGAENVFASMIASGLMPLSTRPFAMLFNTTPLVRVKSVLDYYELMLDYGIAPEMSTMRILCKQSGGMEYACIHFTLWLKRAAAAGGDSPKSTSRNLTSAVAESGTSSPSDSRRKNERAFFAYRLEQLAESQPGTPLLEAMRAVHRAQVEGTSLAGDTFVLTTLLKLFCRGDTPLKDLAVPFRYSSACRPGSAPRVRSRTQDPGEEAGCHLSSALEDDSLQPSDPRVDDNVVDEARRDLSEPVNETFYDEMHNEDPTKGVEPGELSGRRNRGSPRAADVATPAEEAAYVLKVLKSVGSIPDNKMLKDLVSHFGRAPDGNDVVEQVVHALCVAGHESHGALEPVRCTNCFNLMHSLTYRRQRVRLLQLLSAIVTQCYEYTALFHMDWAGESFAENGHSFMTLATLSMKVGPLDWALGVLCLALVVSSHVVLDSTKNRLLRLRDVYHPEGPLLSVLDSLESCQWNREKILCCDALMLDVANRAANGGGGSASGGLDHGFKGSPPDASHGKYGLHPSSLPSCMHAALREMRVSRDAIGWLEAKLAADRHAALQQQAAQE